MNVSLLYLALVCTWSEGGEIASGSIIQYIRHATEAIEETPMLSLDEGLMKRTSDCVVYIKRGRMGTGLVVERREGKTNVPYTAASCAS